VERIAALTDNVKLQPFRPFVGFSSQAFSGLEQSQALQPSASISCDASRLDLQMQAYPDLEDTPRGCRVTAYPSKHLPCQQQGFPGHAPVVDLARDPASWSTAHSSSALCGAAATQKGVQVAGMVGNTAEQSPVHTSDGSRFHVAGTSNAY